MNMYLGQVILLFLVLSPLFAAWNDIFCISMNPKKSNMTRHHFIAYVVISCILTPILLILTLCVLYMPWLETVETIKNLSMQSPILDLTFWGACLVAVIFSVLCLIKYLKNL